MYRDVKKKLLSVALCVCMIIGMVQVVPKAKAAVDENSEGYYPINVGYTGDEGSSLTVYVKLKSGTTYTYADKAYIPEIKQVVTDMGNPGGSDITGCFNESLKIVDGSNINAGTFYGVIVPKNTYSVTYDNENGHDNEIAFTINPATIDYISVNTGSSSNPVLAYVAGGVSPQLETVTVSCESTDIVYSGSDIDQYCSISKIDEIGKGKISLVKLNANSNFSNWDDVSVGVNCDVAFDLGDLNYAVLNQTTLTYTGGDLSSQVTMDVYGKDHTLIFSGANKNNNLKFIFKKGTASSEQLIEPGTYEVMVTPSGGANKTAQLGTGLYTGTCTGTIDVGLRTPSTIEITADDENGDSVTLKGDNSYLYRISLDEKNIVGEVLPKNMKVTVNGTPLNEGEYSLAFEDQYGNTNDESGAPVKPTKAGQYKMTVTLDPSTTYTGKVTVMYYVYTNLRIETIQFVDVNKINPTNLPFRESGYEVETDNQKLIVKDISGNTLTLNRHFEIEYRYPVENGNGVDWKVATGFNGAGMTSVGTKRIYIKGIKSYFNESVYWEYTIDPVNITEANGFKLALNGGPNFDYTGEEIKPEYTFTYNGDSVKKEYYEDDYTGSITDAGNGLATLTVTAKDDAPFSGSMSVTYNINALQLSNAHCVGDGISEDVKKYTYTGKPITPELHIGDYNLEIGRDYVVEKYKNATTGAEFADAPTVPGKYIACIKEGTNSQNVKGAAEIPYEIIVRDMDYVNVSFVNGSTVEWNGGKTEPEIICGFGSTMISSEDYTVTYQDNEKPSSDAVSACAIVTGKNYFTGSKTIYFKIAKRKISNANVSLSYDVDKLVPPYAVSFTVRDNGNAVEKPVLVETDDYKITKIVYKSGNDYTPNVSDLNALEKAGVYEVTFEGQGNYTGEAILEVACGTNLADLVVKLDKGSFTYNGQEQFPKITVTNGTSKIYFNKGDDKATTEFYPIFTRDEDSDVPDGCENINAGTVQVKIVGNTEKGYYGEKSCGEYTISPLDIAGDKNSRYVVDFSADPDLASIDDQGYAHYKFTNLPIKPQVVVSKAATNIVVSAPAILTRKSEDSEYGDYTISYEAGDTCVNQGTHRMYIDGVGNFTGRLTYNFIIEKMSIDDSANITYTFSEQDISQIEGNPTIHLWLSGEELTIPKDYRVDITREKSPGSDWEDTVVYNIIGQGNFYGTSRIVKFSPLNKTTLNQPADPDNPQSGEAFVVHWNYDELTVSPGSISLVTPSGFVLAYVKENGNIVNLDKTDYKVTKYVPAKKPGLDSTMQIQGIGGFEGGLTINVPLFTDIKEAEFITDDDGEYTGDLKPGGSISLQKLQDAINNDQLSNLIWFKNIWPEETGGRIDPSCYSVTASKELTLGKLTLTVAGNEEKFYTGSRSFDVTVTGELKQGITNVEVGDDNVVAWKGMVVTPGAVKVQVYNEGQLLTGGYLEVGTPIPSDWDYTVSFSGNNGVGLATATINGVNSFSGKVTQPFKITYLMNDLTIQIQNKDGAWVTYNNGDTPEYPFKIDTEKNKPAIKLYYSMANGTLSELDEIYYSVVYNNFTEAEGASNISISEPQEEKYQGILLGSGRWVKYYLTSIPMDDVSIELGNRYPVYTGNEMTVTDIGLTLKYGNYSLKETDYSLKFRYAINTDEVDGRQAEVIISGNGNFSGSVTKYFSIMPLPIGSETFIVHNVPQALTYTGQEQVPVFTVSQVQGSVRTLKEETDYKIVKYLDDSKTVSRETPFSDVGTYYVRIEGLGNYHNTRDIEYQIQERQISDNVVVTFVNSEQCPVINGVPQCVYNGKEHRPEIKVMYNDKELTVNTEYTVEYGNNKNATRAGNKATVTISGTGSFDGTRTIEFAIQPKSITGTDISYRDKDGNIFKDEQTYEWTKSSVKPVISVYDGTINEVLIQGASDDENAHYSVEYYDTNGDGNTQCYAGQVTMTITGQGNYTGTQQFTYYIGEDISKSYTLINGQRSVSTTYNGLVQAPDEKDITVVWEADTDSVDQNKENRYNIAYYNEDFSKTVSPSAIVNAGKYYISVVGVPSKGTYAKSSEANSCVYMINPRSIAPAYILVSGYDGTYYYTGQPIQPQGLSVEDTDLPTSSDVNDPQRRSVKLTYGTDYELSYANNVSAGKASIIVTGKGNYIGSRTAYFNIISSNAGGNNTWDGSSEGTGSISNGTTTIAASDIILGYDNSVYECMMYNGYERIPTVNIAGISNNEFIITASNNIRPGIATLTITGRGNNFTGTIIKNYKIKADLSYYGTIATIADQVYSGYQITPHVTLTCGGNLLNQGSDYTVTYLNNTNVGRATVMATATSDSYYIGSATGTFNISNTAGGMEITGYGSAYTYTGYPIAPDVVVTMNGRVLNRGTDYTVTYSNNTNVGTATMTVTGIGSFSGTKTITYAIEAKNIENCLTTAVTSYQYTGSTYTPSVTVTDSSNGKTLVAGTDYTITYSNNTNPGTASITVTALSKNYTGTKVIPFKITSAAVSGLRTSTIKNNSIKLAWSAQDYADGYQICNSSNRVVATTNKNSYTVSGLTSCTTYKFKVRSYVENADGSVSYGNFSTAVSAKTLLNTPKLTAKSTSKGKVTLTWTKVSKATGYEIYYSTKKDGIYTRLKTVSKSSSRKYVDSGLASGEKYYYTIRAYRTSNGVKTYSNYNTIKSVKVK